MIRINLLPAGLRKKQKTEFNPEKLLIVAGVVLILLVAGFWAWVKFVRIPAAEELYKQKETELAQATQAAQEVLKMEDEVRAFQAQVDYLKDLIGRKAYWAETINDLADLLGTDDWGDDSAGELRVSCRQLTLQEGSPSGSSRGGGGTTSDGTVPWDLSLSMQLVGRAYERRGDYIRIFFARLGQSRFWVRNNLQPDDPETIYKGDEWSRINDMNLIQFNQEMRPRRIHTIEVPGLEEDGGGS